MAATFGWQQANGAATGSPATGTTISSGANAPTECNWSSSDTCAENGGTVYSSAPVVAGTNSFEKWLFGYFSGTFNQISAGLFAHTAGVFGTGLTLGLGVTSSYTTPSQSLNSTACTVNATTAIAIGSGATVLFSPTSPQAASPTSTLTASTGYTQFLVTQLVTTTSAGAGDCAS